MPGVGRALVDRRSCRLDLGKEVAKPVLVALRMAATAATLRRFIEGSMILRRGRRWNRLVQVVVRSLL